MEMESCVPPGFRFHPTEEELVGYYLKRKINSLKIDLEVIVDIDLYKMEPWDIQEKCNLGYDEQSEWYFFSHKDRKYPTGTRTNRATTAGFWKATGRDKAVVSKNKIIGMRKTLVFYSGRAPNGRKSDWIMHEYRLQNSQNEPPQEEGWVVCRAFKKPVPNQRPGFDHHHHQWNMHHHGGYNRTDDYDNHSRPLSSSSEASSTSYQLPHLPPQNHIPHHHHQPHFASPSISSSPSFVDHKHQHLNPSSTTTTSQVPIFMEMNNAPLIMAIHNNHDHHHHQLPQLLDSPSNLDDLFLNVSMSSSQQEASMINVHDLSSSHQIFSSLPLLDSETGASAGSRFLDCFPDD